MGLGLMFTWSLSATVAFVEGEVFKSCHRFKWDQDSLGVSSYKYLIIWSYLGLREFSENDVWNKSSFFSS